MPSYRKYRKPLPSTKALTGKIVALMVAAALGIGALISVEMASGNDPALGPKGTPSAKKSTATPSGSGASSSSTGSGTDPYSQQYGYGNSYGSGDNGYSSGSSSPAYSPPPVTSGTS
jgi:hypothetical protein